MNLDAFEEKLDTFYNKPSLTTENKNLALWRILTQFEDVAFLHLTEALKSQEDYFLVQLKYITFIDEHKFQIKYALNRIFNECKDERPFPIDKVMQKKVYLQAWKIYKRSKQYRDISLSIISIRQGEASASIEGKKLKITNNRSQEKHTILQYCGYVREEDKKIEHAFEILMNILKESEPTIKHAIESNISIKDSNPIYKLDLRLLEIIFNKVTHKLFEVPDDWVFPWSTLDELRCYFRSLNTICIYHIMMNQAASAKYKIKGGGIEKRLLIMSGADLIELIGKISNLKKDVIDKINRYLTYGYKTNKPDISLQPLIDFNDKLIICPQTVMSLNYERNALSLHLRVAKKNFDSQSYKFENGMITRFSEKIGKRFKYDTNFHLANRAGGEIDAIIIDELSKTIVICELKWVLTPADPNEILKKYSESEHKISQAIIKSEEAKRQKRYILNRFNIKSESLDDWKVYPFALFENFPGIEGDPKDGIIALPMYMFFNILNHTISLRVFCDFIKSGAWLPVEDLHYKKTKETFTFGGLQIEIGQIEVIDLAEYLFEYIPYSIQYKQFSDKAIKDEVI